MFYNHRKERELAEMKRRAKHHLPENPEAERKLQDLEKEKSEADKKIEAIQNEERVIIVVSFYTIDI